MNHYYFAKRLWKKMISVSYESLKDQWQGVRMNEVDLLDRSVSIARAVRKVRGF